MCNLNTASVREIAQLHGVTLAQAYDLALWRPYSAWWEVAQVPGLDRKAVAALRSAGATVDRPPR